MGIKNVRLSTSIVVGRLARVAGVSASNVKAWGDDYLG
jgi:hypothetical protein